MKLSKIYFAFLSILAISIPASAQKFSPGPQVLTFFSNVDDTEQPYGLIEATVQRGATP